MTTENFSLSLGDKYPFDASDEWNNSDGKSPPPPTDWAHRAARGIVSDLTDRRGIKHGFGDVDEDIRKEIVETLAGIIRDAYSENGLSASKITSEQWQEAKDHLDATVKVYKELPGVAGLPALAITFAPLLKRYEQGERSEDLYEGMTSVE